MAIKYYESEPRKVGYKGTRVSCTLDGKHILEYSHPSKRAEAEARHAELMKQVAHRGSKTAQRHVQYAYSAPRYDPPRRTGVVGLTIAFHAQKKCIPLRHYPVILIANQDKTRGVSNITSRAIKKRDLEATWKESCQRLWPSGVTINMYQAAGMPYVHQWRISKNCDDSTTSKVRIFY